jgi:hypothetical protein
METFNNKKIIIGDDAKNTLSKLLDNESYKTDNFKGVGYFSTNHKGIETFIAFDNTTNNCWVEEFSSEKKAINFCKGNPTKNINGYMVG